MPASVDAVLRVALSLPRAYEALVRDQVKFRVGRIVFLARSRDETVMGVGFPRELRAAAVEAEMTELVTDSLAMCVPQKVRREWFGVE